VNLASPLAGWSRFAAADDWLSSAKQEQTASMQKMFDQFLSGMGGSGSSAFSPKERKEMLDEFVSWTRKSISAPGPAARP
jgi:hypothetical protein